MAKTGVGSASTDNSTIAPIKVSSSNETELPIVLVIGLTGVGKTTFINHLTNANLAVGKGMDACTTSSNYEIGKIDGAEVAFLDTPGFDDPEKSDADILIDITTWIEKHLGGKRKVTAALYIHSILTKKMYGSASRNYSLFSRLVGSESMSNVGLVSTHWDVAEKDDAVDREVHLVTNAWSLMIANGARKYRMDNNRDSAQSIMVDMLQSQPSFIKIQREMAKEFQGKPLSRTEAGQGVCNELLDRIQKEQVDVHDIKQHLAKTQFASPEAKEAFQTQLESAESRLQRLQTDREKVEKVPSWGETIWGLTKRHGLGLAIQGISFVSAGAAGGASLDAATKKIAALEERLAAQAVASSNTASYVPYGVLMGVGFMGVKLLGWA